MKKITQKISIITSLFFMSSYVMLGQCAATSNIYTFEYGGKVYEVVKENKTWADAAACAVERGGILAEINDVEEQNAIYTELTTNADITVSNTVAPDGGGGAYVWLGGNDLSVEGNWGWDGNNDGDSTPFWLGSLLGSPVDDLYNNWGNEPDNFEGQDALGLSLNGWPLGNAGQWNDVDHTNTLYYVIEYPAVLGVGDLSFSNEIKLYPNPVGDFLTIETSGTDFINMVLYNALGQELRVINLEENRGSKTIDVSNLNSGIHFLKINSIDGRSVTKKITK